MTGIAQEEIAAIFNRAAAAYTITGLRTDEETLVQTQFPKPPAKILIVGCGAGRTVIPLAKRGFDVIGVDISPLMIDAAHRQVRDADTHARLLVGDAARLAELFASETFDVIWFPFHSLDYVVPHSHRIDALRASALLLRPNGVLVYSSHNRLFHRTLRQYLLFRKNGLALIKSSEGALWTQTVLPWSAGKDAAAFFSTISVQPRYQLIPAGKKQSLKERITRLFPWLDKSIYVIARDPQSAPEQHANP